ncbi:MAG: FAD-dependent thymidylate synthase [Pseudomonadota bacterium]|nr:FAD-dependent thymidylate synthase [Pseudomonadota bacterium]
MIKADIEVKYIDHMGSDLSIVNAARVSFDKVSEWSDEFVLGGVDEHGEFYNRKLKDADSKLIKYLAKHKHKSPFNHTFATVKVKAPVFVSRQLVKHKFMPWNEESRRYINTEPEFYFPDVYRKAAENVKQGSSNEPIKFIDLVAAEQSVNNSLEVYRLMLQNEVCNEQARMFLPQNMMVNWYWSGTLGAFADMLVLRLDTHTQAETRIVAEKIRDILMEHFPVSLTALLERH